MRKIAGKRSLDARPGPLTSYPPSVRLHTAHDHVKSLPTMA